MPAMISRPASVGTSDLGAADPVLPTRINITITNRSPPPMIPQVKASFIVPLSAAWPRLVRIARLNAGSLSEGVQKATEGYGRLQKVAEGDHCTATIKTFQ